MGLKLKCTCGAKTTKKRTKFVLLRAGQILSHGNSKYIVAQIHSRQFMLICLKSGNRWSDQLLPIEGLTATAMNDGFSRDGE